MAGYPHFGERKMKHQDTELVEGLKNLLADIPAEQLLGKLIDATMENRRLLEDNQTVARLEREMDAATEILFVELFDAPVAARDIVSMANAARCRMRKLRELIERNGKEIPF